MQTTKMTFGILATTAALMATLVAGTVNAQVGETVLFPTPTPSTLLTPDPTSVSFSEADAAESGSSTVVLAGLGVIAIASTAVVARKRN